MKCIKEIIKKINEDLKETKKMSYNMKYIFIKLDEDMFKKDIFEINKTSVIYGKVNNKNGYKIISLK